ncbi:hypothetical protein [Thiolapillus sp.]
MMTKEIHGLVLFVTIAWLLGGCSSEQLPRTIYTAEDNRLGESGIKLYKMVLLNEDDDFIQLEVDYEYAGNAPADQVKLFVMPNHGYWLEKAIEVKPGRNLGRMTIGLSRGNMEAKKVTASTTTLLTVSFDHYKPEKYVGALYQETVPFRKEWALPDQS